MREPTVFTQAKGIHAFIFKTKVNICVDLAYSQNIRYLYSNLQCFQYFLVGLRYELRFGYNIFLCRTEEGEYVLKDSEIVVILTEKQAFELVERCILRLHSSNAGILLLARKKNRENASCYIARLPLELLKLIYSMQKGMFVCCSVRATVHYMPIRIPRTSLLDLQRLHARQVVSPPLVMDCLKLTTVCVRQYHVKFITAHLILGTYLPRLQFSGCYRKDDLQYDENDIIVPTYTELRFDDGDNFSYISAIQRRVHGELVIITIGDVSDYSGGCSSVWSRGFAFHFNTKTNQIQAFWDRTLTDLDTQIDDRYEGLTTTPREILSVICRKYRDVY